MSTENGPDFSALDFKAVYEAGKLLPGTIDNGIPWDIGAPQPAVVEIERRGWLYGYVLDAGCGLGDNAIFLARHGYRVTAIDSSSHAVQTARLRADGLPIDFRIADATSLDGLQGPFDSVVDSALYHCLDDAGRLDYLAAVHRVAARGARLSIICFADVPGGMPPAMSLTKAQLWSDLKQTGWRPVDIELGEYLAVGSILERMFHQLDMTPRVSELDRVELPAWILEGRRVP